MNLSDIKKIGILGAGVMAPQIAYLFLQSGYQVSLWDPFVCEAALAFVKNRASLQLRKKRIDQKQHEFILENLRISDEITNLADVQLAIEVVIEDAAIKSAVFAKLSQVVAATTIIASNTSSLSINLLAKNVSNPDRFMGLHFFNPVNALKLVEIIPTDKTSAGYIDLIEGLLLTLGKEGVRVNDSPGFVVNRLLIPLINEAAILLEEGVAPAKEIDRAMRLGANFPLGPLELADLIGLDVCLAIMQSLNSHTGVKISNLLRQYVAKGCLGRKTKSGFFQY